MLFTSNFHTKVLDVKRLNYNTVNVCIIFSTQKMLPTNHKDTLSFTEKSGIIYKFHCAHCDSEYVGKSTRQLCVRMDEHVPSQIRRSSTATTANSETTHEHHLRQRKAEIQQPPLPSTSNMTAVRLHLLENPACAAAYSKSCFQILAQGRSYFHLSVLEAFYIYSYKPILCRHKEFVYTVKLFDKFSC